MKTIKLKCQYCKRIFEEAWSQRTRKFCTFKCYQLSRPKKIKIQCQTCHITFKAYAHAKRKYCSDKCMYANIEWRKKQQQQQHTLQTRIHLGQQSHQRNAGKNNPNYKHGIYMLYATLKKQANGICQECNQGIKNNLSFLDIHHKDENRQNNNIDNLIMLCPNCHRKKHLSTTSTIIQSYKKHEYNA